MVHKTKLNASQTIENKDLSEVTNNRELKLLESMTPYNIKVKHIPADKNTFADALSRLPSKSDTTPPPYIERYTKIQIRPHPQQAKIRVIRAHICHLSSFSEDVLLLGKMSSLSSFWAKCSPKCPPFSG